MSFVRSCTTSGPPARVTFCHSGRPGRPRRRAAAPPARQRRAPVSVAARRWAPAGVDVAAAVLVGDGREADSLGVRERARRWQPADDRGPRAVGLPRRGGIRSDRRTLWPPIPPRRRLNRRRPGRGARWGLRPL